jgi:predicted permease
MAILRDVTHAWRSILRMPLLAGVVVLSLGAGIGVNTTVFSFVQSRVLRPLPGVSDPTAMRLVEPFGDAGAYPGASWAEYQDLSARLRAFDDLFAFRIQALTVGTASQAERTSGLLVSGNYFPALGLRPSIGRLIAPDDAARPGGEPVVVLSHEYWQQRFGADVGVVGQTLRVNDRELTIVGVTPEAFKGTVIGMRFDLWVPATLAPVLMDGTRELEERSMRGYQIAGRIRSNASVAQAQTELDAAMDDLAATYADTNRGIGGQVLPFWESPRGPQRMLVRALAILQGLMLILWLAVCGNTATLLLARASSRQQEVGVRLAMGANPLRVVRLLLTENLLLALGAAAVGGALAVWMTPLVAAIPLSTGFPVRMDATVDAQGLAFAATLAVLSALVFGLAPALHLARVDPLRALGAGARATAGSWARHAMMSAQVGLALIVLIAAGLFFRAIWETRDIDPGFVRDGVLVARYDLTGRTIVPSASRQFARRTLDAMRAIPGVEAAAIAQQVPLDIHGLPMVSFTLEGRARTDGALDRAISNVVSPGYFETLQVPFVAGRDFVEIGDTAAPRQAIVNDAFVARYLADGESLQRRIEVAGRAYAIVGVVKTTVSEAFGEAPKPCIYFSYRDRPAPVGQFHLRTRAGDERRRAAALREVVAAIDPSLPVYDVRTLGEHVDANLGLRKIPARLFMGLGPLLLALAATGIYAVVACTVASRTREIGVRLAMGATSSGVVRGIVFQTMRSVAAGSAIGWLAAYAAYTSLLQRPVDVPIFTTVPVVLLTVAALASWLPARLATRIDPVVALRVQ